MDPELAKKLAEMEAAAEAEEAEKDEENPDDAGKEGESLPEGGEPGVDASQEGEPEEPQAPHQERMVPLSELLKTRRKLAEARKQINQQDQDPEAMAADLEERFTADPGKVLAEIVNESRKTKEPTPEELQDITVESYSKALEIYTQEEIKQSFNWLEGMLSQPGTESLREEYALLRQVSRDPYRDTLRFADELYWSIPENRAKAIKTEAERLAKQTQKIAIKTDLSAKIRASVDDVGSAPAAPSAKPYEMPYSKRIKGLTLAQMEAAAEAD